MTVSGTAQAQTHFPGFDARFYPGDSVMRAWLHPSSPYRWVGYYLPAPCHRDSSFVNKYATLAKMGWGTAAIYAGQQDFSQMSSTRAADVNKPPSQPIICSATLLTAAQGTAEAGDAAAKMAADGFPKRSAVFLDVELVTVVTPALLDYVGAWVAGVLRDGRYRPGIYTAKPNMPALYSLATAAYRKARVKGAPAAWVSTADGFSLNSAPAGAGLRYATIWQGVFSESQTWNGATLIVDVNVAKTRSPGKP
jgi:hypothetical protein